MFAEVLALLTFIVSVITYLDELTWAKEHAALLNQWLLHKLSGQTSTHYRHNPCRSYRVQGPERKV